MVDFGGGHRGEAALLQSLDPGDKVRIALRPETIGIGKQDGVNQFPARVVDRRYQGTQTVYDVELFGRRLEALELGTAARHQVGVETHGVAAARRAAGRIGTRGRRITSRLGSQQETAALEMRLPQSGLSSPGLTGRSSTPRLLVHLRCLWNTGSPGQVFSPGT